MRLRRKHREDKIKLPPPVMDGPPVKRIDPQRLTGAIYGTILVTAVVATLSEDEAASNLELLETTAGTAFVFYAAHVYSELLALRVTGVPWSWATVRQRAIESWPIAQAAAPACVALLAGMTEYVDDDEAVDYAIGAGIVALFGWGFAIGRAGGQGKWGCIGSGVLNASFGMVIVGLKILVH